MKVFRFTINSGHDLVQLFKDNEAVVRESYGCHIFTTSDKVNGPVADECFEAFHDNHLSRGIMVLSIGPDRGLGDLVIFNDDRSSDVALGEDILKAAEEQIFRLDLEEALTNEQKLV